VSKSDGAIVKALGIGRAGVYEACNSYFEQKKRGL
jgi:hypothetical protein